MDVTLVVIKDVWFLQKQSLEESLSGPLICKKAIDFNIKLNGDKEFKASPGLLRKFKSTWNSWRKVVCQ